MHIQRRKMKKSKCFMIVLFYVKPYNFVFFKFSLSPCRVYGSKEGEGAGDNDDIEPLEEAVEISDLLNEGDEFGRLPPHHRCSAHSLNLLATSDAEKANQI